jgi:hypothetical protein
MASPKTRTKLSIVLTIFGVLSAIYAAMLFTDPTRQMMAITLVVFAVINIVMASQVRKEPRR